MTKLHQRFWQSVTSVTHSLAKMVEHVTSRSLENTLVNALMATMETSVRMRLMPASEIHVTMVDPVRSLTSTAGSGQHDVIFDVSSHWIEGDMHLNLVVLFYSCKCMSGFEGDRCEINVDDCIPHACLNNGTCQDEIDAYSCLCLPGYTGEFQSLQVSQVKFLVPGYE